MADWTDGFDALRTALMFRAQRKDQKEQQEKDQAYRDQMLGLQKQQLEQTIASQKAGDDYRNRVLEQTAARDKSALELDQQQHQLNVSKFLSDRDASAWGNNMMPAAGAMGGMPGAGGMSWTPSGMTVGEDGVPRYTYKPMYQVEAPTFETIKTPGGADVTYQVAVNPSTGQKEYTRIPRTETEETKDEATTVANILMAQKSLDNLGRAVNQYGNYESPSTYLAPLNWFSNARLEGRQEDYNRKLAAGTLSPEEKAAGMPMDRASASAIMQADPYELAIAMAKVVDPGSVAREGEVAAAKRFLIPLGFNTANDVSTAAIARAKQQLEDRIDALGLRDKVSGALTNPAQASVNAPDQLRKFDSMEEFQASGDPFGLVWDPVSQQYRRAGEIQ